MLMHLTHDGTLHGLSVLVVEDDKSVRDALSVLLKAAGAQVATARDGREALMSMGQREFEVLLVDLNLPDTGGDVVIRWFLDRTRWRPHVVAVTAASEPYLSRAREAGADVVLEKPFMFEDLMALLMPLAQPGARFSVDESPAAILAGK